MNNIRDTYFGMPLNNYISVVNEIGFKQVLCIPFIGSTWNNAPAPNEKFYVFFNESRGILLSFDTYSGKSVNGGKFYYNIKPKEDSANFAWSNFTWNGGFRGEVWVGYHECRESIKFKITRLEEHGTFLTKWVEQPFLWLLHYMDTKDKNYDYKAINAERIAMLPDYVREAITPLPPPLQPIKISDRI
jgi:hypothetical protein